MSEPVPLEGYETFAFEHDGAARAVYRRGVGPAVVVMTEMPGITPEVAAFGRSVADDGFTVFLPHLFGVPNKPLSPFYAARGLAGACISREFSVLAARASSPMTDWTRALARHAFDEIGGKGVGAIGMCITGNFALAMAVDPFLMAPVLSQPSLPFSVGRTRTAGLHVSDDALAIVKRRVEDEGLKVLGLRFTGDVLCRKERFERLRAELGSGFEGIEIDSSPGNAHGIPRRAHSVVAGDLVDVEGHPTRAALDRVLAFFRERLI